MTAFETLLAVQRRRQRRPLAQAAFYAVLVATASVVLLGLSGWFITAAAIAGAAGPLVAQMFNYMLPSAGIRLLAIVRTGARYGERLAAHEAAFGALARVRPALFAAVASGPVSRALALTSGEATARMVQDVAAVEGRFVRQSAPWSVAGALASGLCLTVLGGWAAAASTVICLVVLLAFANGLAVRLDSPGRAVQHRTGILKQETAALLSAAAELRCYGLESWATARIDAQSHDLAEAQRAQAGVLAWFEGLQATAVALAAVAAALLARNAGAPLVALCALAAAMTIDGAAPVLRALAGRGSVREAEARLDALLSSRAPVAIPAAALPVPGLDLTLAHRYTLAHGERAIVVGVSGAGKTTLLETLLGLRSPLPGTAAIAGRDIAALPAAILRATFAWLPQDAMLLSGTVRGNLLLARPDASEADLWTALHDAALDDRVRALPNGLESWVGENGERLSGGERRRLALARAYLAQAPWLLLDEPGEGLDAETERTVAARLVARLNRTGQGLLLVSHRSAFAAVCSRRLHLAGERQALRRKTADSLDPDGGRALAA